MKNIILIFLLFISIFAQAQIVFEIVIQKEHYQNL